jgi:dihydrofolate synthase/folylpolyglutamate synthase
MDAAATDENSETGPTFFELTTAMALLHFVRRGCTSAVLEVGLGGRLDSTNVCLPEVAVITSISFDHMKQLGNTLGEIAREKAGIIKPGVPTVSGVRNAEAREVIQAVAQERGSPLLQVDRDFDYEYRSPAPQVAGNLTLAKLRSEVDVRLKGDIAESSADSVELGLLGRHQAANLAVAWATVAVLRQQGWSLPSDACRAALAQLRWPARVEIVSDRPTIVIDAAHNVASIQALVATLEECLHAKLRHLIFATTLEKDVAGMLAELLPRFDQVYFTRYSNNPRSVPVEELLAIASAQGATHFSAHASLAEAWQAVQKATEPDSLICVTGSFFIAAEMREMLATQK